MSKPLFTIRKDTSVGIYDNCEYIARVYGDKIIVISPYVKWRGNTGVYAESKNAIRTPEVINEVFQDLTDDCEDGAWEKIGLALDDDYLVGIPF
jgi:hypothetical protein